MDLREYKGIIILFSIIGILLVFYYIFEHFYLFTTDAYIESNVITVSPEVSGIVTKLHIHDMEKIKKGEVLFEIEPTPYLSAQKKAKAALRASHDLHKKLLADKVAGLQNIKAAKADYDFQFSQLKRYQALTGGAVVSMSKKQQVLFFYQQARAQLNEARADLKAIDAQLGDPDEPFAATEKAKGELELANYNLEHTKYRSAIDGYATNMRLRIGDVVNRGEHLFALIDQSYWYVLAKVKEGFLPYLKTHNKVRIWLPSQGGAVFEGHILATGWGVNRIADSANSKPWILPYFAQSEHWIQLAQRFPVKIPFDSKGRDLHFGANATILITLS
jgi:multidrug resistance efflux pump